MSRDTRGMSVVDRVAEYTAQAESEAVMVAWWRYDRFQELGCDPMMVARLVQAGTDWHAFSALVAAGCPLDTAERILSD